MVKPLSKKIQTSMCKEVMKAFLDTYAPKITGQMAHTIGQMEQRTSETGNDYFNRLDQIINKMLSSFMAVVTSQVKTYEDVRNHMQKHLFTSGLIGNIQVEVLKVQPAMLMDSFKESYKTKLILKRPNHGIFAIEENNDIEHGEIGLG
jgi:hypothetical protein